MSRPRLLATQVLYQVVIKHQHLKQALQTTLPDHINSNDKAWIQNICYQALRHHQNLEARWQKFTEKPLKDKVVAELMTLSLAQKIHTSTPDHAIVYEAIQVAKKLKKKWASGLLNKVLKLALNDAAFEAKTETAEHNHPQWWIDLLKKDWPNHYQQIIHANNQKPPLWVRTRSLSTRLSGFNHPTIKSAWLLDDAKATNSQELSGGQYSVQDAAAQLAAIILQPQPGELILDACAAPGGKSCHLLELEPDIKLHILEKEPQRLNMVKDNLKRLNLSAQRLIAGDATDPKAWYEGQKYDKILLDVPCSATGVVRRNPDIKLLRQPEHLKQLTQLQQNIFNQMAHLVKVGGHILYVTCSVFRSENDRQVKKFIKHNLNFEVVPLDIKDSENCDYGHQIITGTQNMDGFYYCLLVKQHD